MKGGDPSSSCDSNKMPQVARSCRKARFFVVVCLLSISLRENGGVLGAVPCTVCADGISEITMPDTELLVPGFGLLSCGTIDAGIGLFLPDDTSNDCQLIRSLSTLCGCPKPAGEGLACELCAGEQEATIGGGGGANTDATTVVVPTSRLDAPVEFLNHLLESDAVAIASDEQQALMTCQYLEAYLHSVEKEDGMCLTAKAWVSSYCCDTNYTGVVAAVNSTCSFCNNDDGFIISDPNQQIYHPAYVGLLPTCDLVDGVVAFLSSESEPCTTIKVELSDECPCGTPGSGGGATNPGVDMKVDNYVPSPSTTTCTLCRDGSDVTMPDRVISFATEQFGFEPTCAQAQLAVSGLADKSPECNEAQLLGSYCGCPALENACILCPNENMTNPDRRHVNTFERFGQDLTCLELEAILLQFDSATDECFLAHETNWECGCNDGFYGYLGTESVRDYYLLTILARISGGLSMVGSLFIFIDFWRGDRTNIYRQIMLFMSCFDFTTAMGWMIGSWPVPDSDIDGNDTNIFGARGNDALCTAQGFFIMLGYGSGFFNNSLSFYYILVVVWGWKDMQLRKARKWLLSIPVLCAMTLAFAGIPFYGHVWVGCWIVPHPYNDSKEIIGFGVVPIIVTTVISTACQIRVYLKVRSQLRSSLKWTLKLRTTGVGNPVGGSNEAVHNRNGRQQAKKGKKAILLSTNAEAAVFWQSAFYLLGYYICWPILIVAILNAESQSLNFWAVLSFIAPLQGFLNCLVFVRPRIMKWRRGQFKARKEREMKEARRREVKCAKTNKVPDPSKDDKSLAFVKADDVSANGRLEISSTTHGGTSRTDSVGDTINDGSATPTFTGNDGNEKVLSASNSGILSASQGQEQEDEEEDPAQKYPSLV